MWSFDKKQSKKQNRIRKIEANISKNTLKDL